MTTETAEATPAHYDAGLARVVAIDPAFAVDASDIDAQTAWLRATMDGRPPRTITGLSGGIDSAVTAFVAVRALGHERPRFVSMPYGLRAPATHPASHPDSLAHAQLVVNALRE